MWGTTVLSWQRTLTASRTPPDALTLRISPPRRACGSREAPLTPPRANPGKLSFGEPGSNGYGVLTGGAKERSNVDLTEELVNLIAAQRNFQSNAKALETSSALTQTMLNIRG